MSHHILALSTSDKANILLSTIAGMAVVCYLGVPWLLDLVVPFESMKLPQPFDRIHVASVVFGFVVSSVVASVPAIYRERCNRLLRDRQLVICRD